MQVFRKVCSLRNLLVPHLEPHGPGARTRGRGGVNVPGVLLLCSFILFGAGSGMLSSVPLVAETGQKVLKKAVRKFSPVEPNRDGTSLLSINKFELNRNGDLPRPGLVGSARR